jgi:hypothetical protein
MHVYADTWAHQGFVGVNHRVNAARNLVGGDGQAETLPRCPPGPSLPHHPRIAAAL